LTAGERRSRLPLKTLYEVITTDNQSDQINRHFAGKRQSRNYHFEFLTAQISFTGNAPLWRIPVQCWFVALW